MTEDVLENPAEVAAYVSTFAAELADMARRSGLWQVANALEQAQRAAATFIEGRTLSDESS